MWSKTITEWPSNVMPLIEEMPEGGFLTYYCKPDDGDCSAPKPEPPVEESTEEPTEAPTEEPTEAPTEEPTEPTPVLRTKSYTWWTNSFGGPSVVKDIDVTGDGKFTLFGYKDVITGTATLYINGAPACSRDFVNATSDDLVVCKSVSLTAGDTVYASITGSIADNISFLILKISYYA